jgi:hypothetical protein
MPGKMKRAETPCGRPPSFILDLAGNPEYPLFAKTGFDSNARKRRNDMAEIRAGGFQQNEELKR